MTAATKAVTTPTIPHPGVPPISNRKSNHPIPHVTPRKQTIGPQLSNRESLRLEINATPTKQSPALRPNREKEAWFSAPVGEGVYLPPGFGLGVGWDLGGMRDSGVQNSNREGRRLETGVKLPKQWIRVSSNRELEAVFFAPSSPSNPTPPGEKGEQKANRESLRLEINVTPTKQTPDLDSNREKTPLLSRPSTMQGGPLIEVLIEIKTIRIPGK
jgi:hypothetical protein